MTILLPAQPTGLELPYHSVEHFEGLVSIQRHNPQDQNTAILTVRFAPGSRTAWHSHEQGQYLESLRGIGWVHVRGAEMQLLYEGDRVWCPPGTAHRHGASKSTEWTQFSITPGKTDWAL